MNTSSLRRNAQVTLAVIAALAAIGSGYRYFARGGSLFSDHVIASPSAGPVGLRPAFSFAGYPGGRKVKVYLCARATGSVQDCADMGEATTGERFVGNKIPTELPDGTTVAPGEYVLRVGPEDDGSYPDRGDFDVVAFRVGPKANGPTFEGVSPADLEFGEPVRVATGVNCRPPNFLADGRVVVGSTVFDPVTNTSIEFDIDALEMTWSPVGDKLAVLTRDRKEIRLAAPDGSGATTRVREARGLLSSLSWSPEGDRLAYIAQPDPATRQTVGDPTSPVVTILNATNGSKTIAGPGLGVSWSPDPKVLAVERSDGSIEKSTPDGKRQKLTTGTRPAWSHDGRLIAVTRAEGEQLRGWVVPVAGGGNGIAVTGPGGCAMSFSPTARLLAVVANQNGQTALQLRTIEVTSGP